MKRVKMGLSTILCVMLLLQFVSFAGQAPAALAESKPDTSELITYTPDLDNLAWKYHRQSGPDDAGDLDIPVKKTDDGRGIEIDFAGLPIDGVAYDTAAPDIQDGEISYKLELQGYEQIRVGFVMRHANNHHFSMLNFDAGGWGWQKRIDDDGSWGPVDTIDNVQLQPNVEYDIRIRYVGNEYTLWVDGEKVIDSTLSLTNEAGKFGIRNWFTSNRKVILKDIVFKEYEEPALPDPNPVVEQTIESDVMRVVLDNNYPRVLGYEWKEDGSVLFGQEAYIHTIALGGDEYFIDHAEIEPVGSDQLDYTLYVQDRLREEGALPDGETAEIRAVIDVSMKVEDNKLHMEVTDIDERIGEVSTIEFVNNYYASVKDNGTAGGTFVRTTGNWHELNEEQFNLQDQEADETKTPASYGTIYDGEFAISVENNAINTGTLLHYAVSMSNGTKILGLGDGIYTYRHQTAANSEWADKWDVEALPKSTVVIGKDQNGDGIADWQDGAILLRDILDVPFGGEEIKNYVPWIAHNIGSHAQSNFLYTLDVAKALSNYYDGFGQMMLHKGYQGEGHDDAIPDYGGHIGVHHGGKEDFNLLLDEAEKLNVKVGVHVNLTEYMLDAYYTPVEFLDNSPNFSRGWGWSDQAYYVDQTKDLLSHKLYERFDHLKEDAPGLDWVYVDVYTGAGWNAKKVAEKINDNGWWLGTEFRGPLEQDAIWTHWGTDVLYPVGDVKTSDFYRMVKNGTQDTHVWHELLKGVQQASVSSWQGAADMKEGMHVFYNNNLATKYMQHFGITKMDEDGQYIEFDNGKVVVVKENNPDLGMGERVNLYKDDKLVATLPTGTMDYNRTSVSYSEAEKRTRVYSKIFIPWDPEDETKIYHWNAFGGESTWELPDSWGAQTEVKLYALNSNGRDYIGTLPVEDGKVSIDAEQDTPYIVLKGDDSKVVVTSKEKDNKWGEGSLVKDPSFNSLGFKGDSVSAAWEKEADIDTTDHIQNKLDNRYQGIMEISGADGAGGTISQEITGLEPGQDYILGVWADVEGDREAKVEVDFGYKQLSNTTGDTHGWRNRVAEHKMSNSYYHRMSVRFRVPEGKTSAVIKLSADDGPPDSVVRFEDVRLYQTPGAYDHKGHWYYEDFENVDQDHGPFVHGSNNGTRIHLADYNPDVEQYQVNVIDGNWSLKINQSANGLLLRTIDATLKLENNTNYKMGFDYATATNNLYEIGLFARTGNTVEQVAVKQLPRTTDGPLTTPVKGRIPHESIEWEFTTGDADEYYIGLSTPQRMNSIEFEYLLLDNLYIDHADVDDSLIQEVIDAIASLPDVITANDRAAVEDIMARYNQLNGTEQARVDNYDKLDNALKTLYDLDEDDEDIRSSADIKTLVERLDSEGAFANDQSVRSLTVHLTAVGRYEEKQAADKVVKHMNSFKLLLDDQREKELVSDKAYSALQAASDVLIRKWQ